MNWLSVLSFLQSIALIVVSLFLIEMSRRLKNTSTLLNEAVVTQGIYLDSAASAWQIHEKHVAMLAEMQHDLDVAQVTIAQMGYTQVTLKYWARLKDAYLTTDRTESTMPVLLDAPPVPTQADRKIVIRKRKRSR